MRSLDLAVERLEQGYVCFGENRYDYTAPAFDTRSELVYDESGLVLDYPDIAVPRTSGAGARRPLSRSWART